MLKGKTVRVYPTDAAVCVKQDRKPLYDGKVVEMSAWQTNSQTPFITMVIVANAQGILAQERIENIQLILK